MALVLGLGRIRGPSGKCGCKQGTDDRKRSLGLSIPIVGEENGGLTGNWRLATTIVVSEWSESTLPPVAAYPWEDSSVSRLTCSGRCEFLDVAASRFPRKIVGPGSGMVARGTYVLLFGLVDPESVFFFEDPELHTSNPGCCRLRT